MVINQQFQNKCIFSNDEFQSILQQSVVQFFNLFGEVRVWCILGGLLGGGDTSVASAIGRRVWGRSLRNSNRKGNKRRCSRNSLGCTQKCRSASWASRNYNQQMARMGLKSGTELHSTSTCWASTMSQAPLGKAYTQLWARVSRFPPSLEACISVEKASIVQ